MLDWLQNRGCARLRASLGLGGLTAHCLCPPGLRLDLDGSTARFVPADPPSGR